MGYRRMSRVQGLAGQRVRMRELNRFGFTGEGVARDARTCPAWGECEVLVELDVPQKPRHWFGEPWSGAWMTYSDIEEIRGDSG